MKAKRTLARDTKPKKHELYHNVWLQRRREGGWDGLCVVIETKIDKLGRAREVTKWYPRFEASTKRELKAAIKLYVEEESK